MALIPNFKKHYPRLWSVRFGVLAALCSAAEMVLPLLEPRMPKGWFVFASFVATVAALIARAIAQGGLDDHQ